MPFEYLFHRRPMSFFHSAIRSVTDYFFNPQNFSLSRSAQAFVLTLVISVVGLGCSAPVTEQEEADQPPEGALEKVELASKLQEYGEENGEPLALITAAKLYIELSQSAKVLEKDQAHLGLEGKSVDIDALLKTAMQITEDSHVKKVAEIVMDKKVKAKGYYRCVYAYSCSFGTCAYAYVCY